MASIIVKWTLLRVGSPAKLSNCTKRALVREVTKNPAVNLTELQKSYAEMGEPVIRTTISAAKRPLKKSESMRKKVLWSDETIREVGQNSKHYVWRTPALLVIWLIPSLW